MPDEKVQEFQLGDWVTVKGTVENRKGFYFNDDGTEVPVDYFSAYNNRLKDRRYQAGRKMVRRDDLNFEAVVVGVRILHEGRIERYYDEGPQFEQTRTHKVYLLAYNLRGFVKALPEQLELRQRSNFKS